MTDRRADDGTMSTATHGPDGDVSPDAGLPALALHDVGASTAARIRRRALATLQRRELAAQPGLPGLWLRYERAIEPALWLGLGLGYCVWAAAGALAILH